MPDPTFISEIEKFVDEYVGTYPVSSIDEAGKVIHDAVWGTQHLHAHELAILDTPLIQRLRRIKQTAFAYLIFPSATHSRFEHTLGVLFHINRLLKALSENQHYRNLIEGKEDLLRMAGLLHDCGHGPFSHSSKEIFKFLPDERNRFAVV
jgi:HD superfamily phosphohydrolase